MVEPPRISERSSASSMALRNSPKSTPRWVQKRASSATITARGKAGEIVANGVQVRSTRANVIRRHSIKVETGSTKR